MNTCVGRNDDEKLPSQSSRLSIPKSKAEPPLPLGEGVLPLRINPKISNLDETESRVELSWRL